MRDYQVVKIYPSNAIAIRKVNQLLEEQEIQLDKNLDYTCGIYDQNRNLIATGSTFQNTLRCMAASEEHKGEGLMNLIVTHLFHYLHDEGYDHLFMYTKSASSCLFTQLGFEEIVRIEDHLHFLESKKDGFENYLDTLIAAPVETKEAAAIVMNANPFSLGHQYLIETAAKENDWVHLFLLEEDASFFPYKVRRQLVEAGIKHLDNITIQPTSYYIISQATFPSYFQKDEASVIDGHALLDATLFKNIAKQLNVGRRYVGEEPFSEMTNRYNKIMKKAFNNTPIQLKIVPRKGVAKQKISGSTIRYALTHHDWDLVKKFVPKSTYDFLRSDNAQHIIEKMRDSEDVIHH